MHRTEGTNNEANLFTDGPPGTTVDAAWLNAIQEEIVNVIEEAGLAVSTRQADPRTQLYSAIQAIAQKVDYTVYNQTTFEALFTRTGANSYDINSDYRSVYIRNIGSGYSFQNVLSGGDTWGDILTKNCASIEFENGAYINFGDFPGAIEVETDDCLLKNVDVRGEGTVAAVTESFRLNAHRVTFDNCKTSSRNSNVDFAGFEGSATPLHNITSRYVNCVVYIIDGSDKIYGFEDCMNLNGCVVYNMDSSGDHVIGFYTCDSLTTCQVSNLDTLGFSAVGFWSCKEMASCRVNEVDTTNGTAIGFYSGRNISACYAYDIDADSGDASGFNSCSHITSCYANDIDSASGTAEGFKDCEYGAAMYTDEVTNSGNDWIDSVDAQITNKVSTPSVFT